jgi:hypothetical protein
MDQSGFGEAQESIQALIAQYSALETNKAVDYKRLKPVF